MIYNGRQVLPDLTLVYDQHTGEGGFVSRSGRVTSDYQFKELIKLYIILLISWLKAYQYGE